MNTHIRRLAACGFLVACLWTLQAAAQQACPEPLAILDSLLVQGQRVTAIDARQFVVERNTHAVAMNIGDPLCEGDRMATQPNVTAKLLVGRADGKRHELTMLPGATAILRALNRIELSIGRLIAAVHGEFDVVMPLARLAATGTVFEVEVDATRVTVDQLEDETHLTPNGGATAVLDPRTQASSTSAQATAVSALDPAQCAELVSRANRIDIAFLPPVRSRNAIPQVSPDAAPSIYDSARQNAICRDDRAAQELFGRILADWERPQQALEELRGRSPVPENTDSIAVGKALLMRGEPERALGEFERAGRAGGNPVEVAAGMGDARRDLGLLAVRRAQLPVAAMRFDEARAHYVEAARLAATDAVRGILLVDLGDLALLRIGLDPESAEARMAEAAALYQRAREHGDPPHARLGLARIAAARALRIPTQQADTSGLSFGEALAINLALDSQAKRQRAPHWQQARSILDGLLEEIPAFSPAQELLGEVQMGLGDTAGAEKQFRRALAADPGNTSAYGALAETLRGGKKAMYEGAHKVVEVPAVRELESAERAIVSPPIETVTIVPASLTPDMPRFSFTAPGTLDNEIVFTNRSPAAVTVASTAITGAEANAFSVRTNGCSAAAIAPNAECRIRVFFVAGQVGTYRARLELTFTGTSVPSRVELRGEVLPPPRSEGNGVIL